MNRFHLEYFVIALLLFLSQILTAQEKVTIDQGNSIIDSKPMVKVEQSASDKNAGSGNIDIQRSNQIVLKPAPQRLIAEKSSSVSTDVVSLEIPSSATAHQEYTLLDINPGLVFDCKGTPFGMEDAYAVEEGNTLDVPAPGPLVNDIDPEGDEIIMASLSAPAHGTITAAVTNGHFTYVPDEGFTGTDQFEYTLRDADNNYSEPVTVTIQVVEAFNRKPVGISDEYAIPTGTSLDVEAPGPLVNDFDPDGDEIIMASLSATAHGTITAAVTNGHFTYVPDEGFTGTDQFEYTIRDAENNYSEPVTVTIQVVAAFNRIPLGVIDHYGTLEGAPLDVEAPGTLVNDIDPDGDEIIMASLSAPAHGTITAAVTNGHFTYVPDEGFTGTDQFEYTLRDAGNNYSEPVTVIIDVIGTYQPPVASAMDISTECSGLSGTIVLLDGSATTAPEADMLQYTWYETGSIIAGPSSSPTAEVILTTGVHLITLSVEDMCGNISSDMATVTIEDTSEPILEAAFLPTASPNEYEISCSAEDACSEVITTFSMIRIPGLSNPSVSLKNHNIYSLVIDMEKNIVSVKAPDASAFWAKILSDGGVQVDDGQIIKVKYDKSKYKFHFDSEGNLLSVEGNEVTLRCMATDEYGNTGESEATLSSVFLQSFAEESLAGEYKSISSETSILSRDNLIGWYRNYPNPFSLSTTIEFELEESAYVQVSVIDQAGRLVEELSSRQMESGVHQLIWDATLFNPGNYYYRIEYNGNLVSDKMVYLGE